MKIGFVPLDDRPCTREFAGAVARIAGEDLVTPPAWLLGHFLTPGSPEGVISWLREMGPELDMLVASIDMLAYGGLIASRSPEPGYGTARERVTALASIKNAKPCLHILAFNVLMRLSVTCFDATSARHWEMVHRLNILEDKASLGLCSEAELAEKDRLSANVPAEVLARYRQARARNHAINLFSLDLVNAGVIDFLSFCQEDAHVFGPHRTEHKVLRDRVRALGLSDRVKIYAGTDEAGMLLVARAINECRGLVPRFGFLYTPPGAERNVALFEDRPIEENIRLQVSVAGGEVASPDASLRELDCLCLVNCPRSPDADEGGHSGAPSGDGSGNGGSRSDALERLRSAIEAGVPAAVLDIARPNGADQAFMADLLNNVDVARLAGYSAWNTAGNSVGTVVAVLAAANAALKSGAIRSLRAGIGNGKGGASDADAGGRESGEGLAGPGFGAPTGPLGALCGFLFERLVDDWLYQSIVRTEVNSRFASVPGVNLHKLERPEPYGEVDTMVRERLVTLARDLYVRFFSRRPVPLLSGLATSDEAQELNTAVIWPDISRVGFEVRLPWERTFEVQVHVSW
ncbi:MAG: DUF4127 family protein [Betaproteobacteria bacterium]